MKKRTQTNIDKLKNQRRLNVQEQNILIKDGILKSAKYWRVKGIPKPLRQVFEKKGIDFSSLIILDYEKDVFGGSTDEGIFLTVDKVFYEFDADLNADETELIELYVLRDVSHRYEINEHQKGIGKTYGFMALEVLNELNEELR